MKIEFQLAQRPTVRSVVEDLMLMALMIGMALTDVSPWLLILVGLYGLSTGISVTKTGEDYVRKVW